jgi:hypothetical protein
VCTRDIANAFDCPNDIAILVKKERGTPQQVAPFASVNYRSKGFRNQTVAFETNGVVFVS